MEISDKELQSLIDLSADLQRRLKQIGKVSPKRPPVEIKAILEPVAAIQDVEEPIAAQAVEKESPGDFEKLVQLLDSDVWPLAVNPEYICNVASEDDKVERAKGIIEMLNPENGSFLDFGCGQGHVVLEMSNKGKAIGYDNKEQNWNSDLLTTDFNKVVEEGPYDNIFIYDVLDHAEGEEPVDLLKKAASVLAPKGTIYLRLHPWCSRHAQHSYHSKNKAFVHLVFTPEELEKLSVETTTSYPVIHPIKEYEEWIEAANLKKIGNHQLEKSVIEPFFQNNNLIKSRISARWANSPDKNLKQGLDFPKFQMEVAFVDYKLTTR